MAVYSPRRPSLPLHSTMALPLSSGPALAKCVASSSARWITWHNSGGRFPTSRALGQAGREVFSVSARAVFVDFGIGQRLQMEDLSAPASRAIGGPSLGVLFTSGQDSPSRSSVAEVPPARRGCPSIEIEQISKVEAAVELAPARHHWGTGSGTQNRGLELQP